MTQGKRRKVKVPPGYKWFIVRRTIVSVHRVLAESRADATDSAANDHGFMDVTSAKYKVTLDSQQDTHYYTRK